MAIEALTAIVRQPPAPTETDGNWDAIHEKVGTNLPADYRDLIATYGTGAFGDFLWVLSPFTRNRNLNFFDKGDEMLRSYRELAAEFTSRYPFAAFPSPGGVLPCAVTDNGDEIYWLTSGAADEWPIVAYATAEGGYELHRKSLTDFIAQWMSGRLQTDIFEQQGVPRRFSPLP